MKFIKKTIFSAIALIFLASNAFAQQIQPPIEGTIADVIKKIWTYLYWISFPIATLMIIVAGFLFITASGNEAQIKKGRNLLMYTVVGFLVIILASGVVDLISKEFNN